MSKKAFALSALNRRIDGLRAELEVAAAERHDFELRHWEVIDKLTELRRREKAIVDQLSVEASKRSRYAKTA